MEIPKLIGIEVIASYTINLKFSDGVEDDLDFSEWKEKGIFKWWKKQDNFNKVLLDKERNVLKWTEQIELDGDALYFKIRGLSFDEWKSLETHAQIN